MPAPAQSKASSAPPRRPRFIGDIITLAVMFGLLGAVYLLPADTSLSEAQRIGRLTACMPPDYPPLVIANGGEMPGYEVELMQELARRMDLRLSIASNSAMGRDFNPRSWRVTRAQCQILAGGIVQSDITRSFLDTTASYIETGWAAVSPEPITTLEGQRVGFFAGLTGLDRIALSRYLRDAGAEASIVSTLAELEAGLEAGTFDVGVTEALSVGQAAARHGWAAQWLPAGLGRYPIGLGLWKGDLSLKQRVVAELEAMEREGFFTSLDSRYGVVPIATTLAD